MNCGRTSVRAHGHEMVVSMAILEPFSLGSQSRKLQHHNVLAHGSTFVWVPDKSAEVVDLSLACKWYKLQYSQSHSRYMQYCFETAVYFATHEFDKGQMPDIESTAGNGKTLYPRFKRRHLRRILLHITNSVYFNREMLDKTQWLILNAFGNTNIPCFLCRSACFRLLLFASMQHPLSFRLQLTVARQLSSIRYHQQLQTNK